MRVPERVALVSEAALLLWFVCSSVVQGGPPASEACAPKLEPIIYAQAMDRAARLPQLPSLLVSIDGKRVEER